MISLPTFEHTNKNLINFTNKVQFEYLLNGEINFDGHMLFLNNIDKDGYGKFWHKTKSIPAHRFSFMVEYGKVPDDLVVCHKNFCHIRNCVNPKHLKMGTQKENIEDMIELGTLTNGQDSNLATHKNDQIQNMILDIYYGRVKNYKETYIKYNMTQENLSMIMRGKIWKKIVNPILKNLNISINQLRNKILIGVPKGENTTSSKLTWEKVNHIRLNSVDKKSRTDKNYQKFADKYGVSLSTIKWVVYNKSWKE